MVTRYSYQIANHTDTHMNVFCVSATRNAQARIHHFHPTIFGAEEFLASTNTYDQDQLWKNVLNCCEFVCVRVCRTICARSKRVLVLSVLSAKTFILSSLFHFRVAYFRDYIINICIHAIHTHALTHSHNKTKYTKMKNVCDMKESYGF